MSSAQWGTSWSSRARSERLSRTGANAQSSSAAAATKESVKTELAVASVAEAGDDESDLVESFIYGRCVEVCFEVGFFEGSDALGCGKHTQDSEFSCVGFPE